MPGPEPVKPTAAEAPAARPPQLDGEGRPYITLAQFLKKLALVGTGGAAKHRVRAGGILVAGVEELRPGRKLHAGDVVTVEGKEHKVEVAESNPAGTPTPSGLE
jgi:ribosome-associated protein